MGLRKRKFAILPFVYASRGLGGTIRTMAGSSHDAGSAVKGEREELPKQQQGWSWGTGSGVKDDAVTDIRASFPGKQVTSKGLEET